MSVNAQLSPDGQSVTIQVQGRFDFQSHQAFRGAYQQLSGDKAKFVVDMREAEYMDSSALGMLLMLREHAGGDGSDVVIANCGDDIKKILTIANFQKLFAIQ